jgi:SIT4-associating protein SAP185/190
LHNVVYDVVQQVFNGTLDRGYNRTLAFDLFSPVDAMGDQTAEDIGFASGKDITERILDGQAASELSQKNKGMRLGYMGHLTLIAEEVCKFGNRLPAEAMDPNVKERVERQEWIEYVEGTLAETRERDNAVLGGVRPENAIGVRALGTGGNGLFSSNTANTLANAGIGGGGNVTPADSLALQEGTVGQSFEINSGTMLSGFGHGEDDDDDMEEEIIENDMMRDQLDDDEQVGELSFDVDMDYR